MKELAPAFRGVVLRPLAREPGRTLLAVLGVALGVAVFVSVRLASTSAMASFADTVDAVAGRANLQVAGGTEGFDERAYPAVRRAPGVRAAAPIVQLDALARPGGPPVEEEARAAVAADGPGARAVYPEQVLMLGVDVLAEEPFERFGAWGAAGEAAPALAFLGDPRGVAITRTLADRHRLALGDSLTLLASGRPVVLRVRAILGGAALQLAGAGNVVVVDIATAQDVLGRWGRIDRIDLVVDLARRDVAIAAIEAVLPPGARIETPQGRSRQVENMVRAFRLNLTALSFIALFVSAFLILNTVSMSVTRRRREIGILRTLGVTRRQVAALFLAEGAMLGVVGGLLGLGLGTLMARGALVAVSRTLTDLYLVHHASALHPDFASYAIAYGVGVAVALLAAAAPAVEASRVAPASTVREGAWIPFQRRDAMRWLGAAGVALAAAVAAALATQGERGLWTGFASAFLTLLAGALAAPAVTLGIEAALEPVVRRVFGVEGALGTRFLRAAAARTSVVIAAIMVAVGMWVALAIMVGSFRRTVDTWVTQSVRGDLYVEPAGHRLNLSATALPESLVARTRRVAGVAAVDTYRGGRIVHHERPAFVAGVDFAVQRDFGRLELVRGDARRVLDRALDRGEAIVSESFAHHHRLAEGDTLPLATAIGVARVRVGGVFFDYSTDAGVVLVDRGLYARLWNPERTESMALYLDRGADAGAVRRRLLELAGPDLLLTVTPNQTLRRRVLEVFDQTFQITWALQAIAVFVAVLGVAGTLTALILQRRREVGVLRATGALRRQVMRVVFVESGLLGLIGALMGCAAGWLLALILVHVINKQSFGWTIRMTVDPTVFASAILVMTVAATLAGLGPARLAAGRLAAEAVRSE